MVARTAEPRVPELIAGRYEVEATLGKGGMGAVYRVRDRRGGERMALKEMLSPDERFATAAG